MTLPRVLRTGAPLTLTAIRQVAPAAAPGRSARYQYVPTIRPLEMLLDNGWGVYEASQAHAREQANALFARHMLEDFDSSRTNKYGQPIEGSAEMVLMNAHDGMAERIPVMLAGIETLKGAVLASDQQYELAATGMELRYGSSLPPFPTSDLLRVRRPVDEGDSAWTVLNRIQENVMNGGWDTKSVFSGRKSSVRAVEAVAPVMRINEGLWTKAAELAEAV